MFHIEKEIYPTIASACLTAGAISFQKTPHHDTLRGSYRSVNELQLDRKDQSCRNWYCKKLKRKKKIKPLSPKTKGAFIKGHMGLPEKIRTD